MPRKAKKARKKKPTLAERMELRLSAKEKEVFQAAADLQQISLSHWLRLAAWQTIKNHDGRVELISD